MTLPIKFFSSMHYGIYTILKSIVEEITEQGQDYERLGDIHIVNMDHIEGLPDVANTKCFFGYSLEHDLLMKRGREFEITEGQIQFFVGTPKFENEQEGFSEFHISFFYEILDLFVNRLCQKTINIEGEELDISLLNTQNVERIQTSSKDGFIVSECLISIIYSPEL